MINISNRLIRKFSCTTGLKSRTCAVLGAQWGDEGKGKLSDMLAKDYDIVARFNGGSNAGHTIVVDGKKFAFHILPCGLIYEHTLNYLGQGVVVDLDSFFSELKPLQEYGIKDVEKRVKISNRSHMLFGFHKAVDGIIEESRAGNEIGTTKKGIGPCYMSKAMRVGIRSGEFLEWDSFKNQYLNLAKTFEDMFNFKYEDKEAELTRLKEYREKIMENDNICDAVFEINSAVNNGKRLIVEGANAAMLDIDFGSYPYVTSSNTTAGNVASGLGLPVNKLDTIIGVVKAYTTRVGSGPFPTELCFDTHPVGIHLQTVGQEVGVTTGRRRRCGWLDAVLLQYSQMLNNYSSVNITKLDILDELKEIKICTAYENKVTGKKLPLGSFPATMKDLGDVKPIYETLKGWNTSLSGFKDYKSLPSEAKTYIEAIERFANVNVSWIGVGPGRDEMIQKL